MNRGTINKKVKENEIKQMTRENKKYKRNRFLAIILHEGKGSDWWWIDDKVEKFRDSENTYFKVDDGTYVKGLLRFMVYLEGVSTPLHHGHIAREKVTKTVKDRTTKQETKVSFWKIKGLKFDSKLIDILLNRHLADEFTKTHMDLPNLVIIILLCVTTIVGFINVIVTYFGFGG